jgi:5S rRNA maturation endonuclease (ribonuclease M5)
MKNEEFLARLSQLNDMCCDNIEGLLEELGVEYFKDYEKVHGPCPIHEGDNYRGWVLYHESHALRGVWRCWTRECHQQWGKNLLGFIHGVRSKERQISKTDTINWMCRFVGYEELAQLPKPNLERYRVKKDLGLDYYFCSSAPISLPSREKIRQTISIPSKYFLKRKFSAKLLNYYDIGDYKDRAIIPVYDDAHERGVGSVGRSVFEECKRCKSYHRPGKCYNFPKWYNKETFEKRRYLFNYWFAKEDIERTQTVILVEGVADVLRLVEAGIKNCVAMFGTYLNMQQMTLLSKIGAANIICLLDNDEAGEAGVERIKNMYNTMFNIKSKKVTTDVAESNKDELLSILKE